MLVLEYKWRLVEINYSSTDFQILSELAISLTADLEVL